ncbi:hypothetical protein LINPERHAP1_LOCUS43906, partial [Linum perenne]
HPFHNHPNPHFYVNQLIGSFQSIPKPKSRKSTTTINHGNHQHPSTFTTQFTHFTLIIFMHHPILI